MNRLIEGQFRFQALEDAVNAVPLADTWQKQFADGLLRSILQHRHKKLASILEERPPETRPEEWLQVFVEQRSDAWDNFTRAMDHAFHQERPDLVTLAVVIGTLDDL